MCAFLYSLIVSETALGSGFSLTLQGFANCVAYLDECLLRINKKKNLLELRFNGFLFSCLKCLQKVETVATGRDPGLCLPRNKHPVFVFIVREIHCTSLLCKCCLQETPQKIGRKVRELDLSCTLLHGGCSWSSYGPQMNAASSC